jgi:hypothetical protein
MKKLTLFCALIFICGMAGTSEAAYVEEFTNLPTTLKLYSGDSIRFNFDLTQLDNLAVKGSSSTTPFSDVNNYLVNNIIDNALLSFDFTSNANRGGNLDIAFSDGTYSKTLYNGSLTTNYSQDLSKMTELSDYVADGKFSVIITATDLLKKGNGTPQVTITDAKLDVTAHAAPIPNAAWLLGTGLIGVIGVRRRVVS